MFLNVQPIKLGSFLYFFWYYFDYQGSIQSNQSKQLQSNSSFRIGTFGALLSLSFFQSTSLKKGWFLIQSIPPLPSLSLASLISLLIKSIAFVVRLASFGINKVFLQFKILSQVMEQSSDIKGGCPTNIQYRITPTDHQSTIQVYPQFICTQGATQSGVPTAEQAIFLRLSLKSFINSASMFFFTYSLRSISFLFRCQKYLHKPKSLSLMWPSTSRRMLSGLRSL